MRRRARVMRSATSTATRGHPASMRGMRWSAWSSVSTRSTRPSNPPKVTNLDAYLSEPAFRALVPEVVWQKAEYIRNAGNVAVHGNKAPAPELALNVVRELAHVLYWAGRTYLRKGAENLRGKTFDEYLIPTLEPGDAPVSIEELDALKRQHGRSRRRAQGCRRRVGGGCVSGSPPSRPGERDRSRRPATGTRARPAG